MANVELRDVEFRTVKETDKKQFLKQQRSYRVMCFFKRMLVFLVLCGIFVGFQLMARKTVPNQFGENETAEKMLLITTCVFLAMNIISYLELLFQTKDFFDINSTPVLKVRVKKKMVDDRHMYRPTLYFSGQKAVVPNMKTRFVMCELDGDFVLNRINVRGRIPFSNIKTGSEIYVSYREKVSGGIEYYFLA
ncbi:MAG: hypothetical protein K6G64_10930 [Eubacterium sp.]|nr:hypothetical protein [Eubacterium sp.]